MRVAIIGCGKLGLDLARRGERHEWFGTTTTPSRVAEINAAGVASHVLTTDDHELIQQLLGGVDAVVVTLAPKHGACYRGTYVDGIHGILQASIGTPVRRIIFASSVGVYTQSDGSWVDESSVTAPTTERTRALIDAEAEMSLAAEHISTLVLRIAGIWSETRGPMNAATRIAGQSRQDGDAYLNLVHHDDVVTALARGLDSDVQGVVNVSDDRPTTRREYFDPLLKGRRLAPVKWTGAGENRGKRVRNHRMREILGVNLSHPTH